MTIYRLYPATAHTDTTTNTTSSRTASPIYARAVMPILRAIKRELPVSVRLLYGGLGTNNVQHLYSSTGATVSKNWHTADIS
jgi:hypothetical protein